MKIRKAEPKDTREIWEAHVASIRQVCAKDYRQEQIERWSALPYNPDRWLAVFEKDHVLVAEIDGKVEGFCHSSFPDERTGEIVGLYLSPKAIGKGLGRKLAEEALEFLKARRPLTIRVKATRTARRFYEKMGFNAIGPEGFHETRGTRIECIPMEMVLSR